MCESVPSFGCGRLLVHSGYFGLESRHLKNYYFFRSPFADRCILGLDHALCSARPRIRDARGFGPREIRVRRPFLPCGAGTRTGFQQC